MIHVLDFRTEKIIAVLENKPDAAIFWDDIHEHSLETKTETFDFTMRANVKESEHVSKKNLIVIPDEDGYFREFVIYDTYQTKHVKEVKANASYTELAKQKILDPATLIGQTIIESAQYVLQGTDWQLGRTEFVGSRTIVWSQHTDALTALYDLAYLYNLELRFRIEIIGNVISGRYVDLVKRIGNDNKKEIVSGKDLIEVKRRETSDILTALIGVAPDINGKRQEVVRIEDDAALQRWGKNGRHLWGIFKPSSEDLQPEGSNLIRGTRQFDSRYWIGADTGTSTYDEDFKWAKIKGIYPSNVPYTDMLNQSFTFDSGQVFTVSAMFKTLGAGQTVAPTLAADMVRYQPKAVTGVWTRLSWTFTGTEATKALQYFRFESDTASPETPIFVSHIKIEYGKASTEWTTALDERLTELTKAELDKRINTYVQYEADTVSIEHIFGYSHEKVRIGDSTRIKDDTYNPPLYLDARVISVRRSISDKSRKSYVIGDFIEHTEDEIMSTFKLMKVILDSKVDMLKGDLPPANPYDGQLWLDTSNPSQDIWKRYDAASGTWKEGPGGADGTSSFTHIAYANSADGSTDFSTTDSVNKAYIGIYVDNSQNDSTDPTKYKWTLIKGADGTQGVPGAPGENGLTPYFHTAWANSSDGLSGFSTTDSTNRTYIGTYTDYTSADSSDPSKYKWVKVQGPQGPQGIQGLQGDPGADGVAYMGQTAPSNPAVNGTWFQTNSYGDVIAIRKWDGYSWVTAKMDAVTLGVSQLSALSADLGTVTAGIIKGVSLETSQDVKVGRTLYLEWDGHTYEKAIIFNEGYIDSTYDSKITGTTLKTLVKGRSAELYGSTIVDVTAGTSLRLNGATINMNGPVTFNNAQPLSSVAEVGYCALGGMTASSTTGAIVGACVNFKINKNYAPSSVTFEVISGTSGISMPNTANINSAGFYVYLNGGGVDGIFRYWRGVYQA